MMKVELVLAVITLCASVAGSAYSGVYKYGVLNDRVENVQTHQTQQDAQIEKNRTATEDQRANNSAITQQLKDIQAQLDRIERAVK